MGATMDVTVSTTLLDIWLTSRQNWL
jgi:hypothetical protein